MLSFYQALEIARTKRQEIRDRAPVLRNTLEEVAAEVSANLHVTPEDLAHAITFRIYTEHCMSEPNHREYECYAGFVIFVNEETHYLIQRERNTTSDVFEGLSQPEYDAAQKRVLRGLAKHATTYFKLEDDRLVPQDGKRNLRSSLRDYL